MIHWIFGGITLAAVLVATLVGDIRRSILALWVAGLGVGAVYLTIGAELLAIIQWIVSTLVAVSFVFFGVMFGEYRSTPIEKKDRLLPILAVGLGCAFVAVVWLGVRPLPENLMNVLVSGNDVVSLGKRLTHDHFISLHVLGLTLFLVLIGGGIIARPEKRTGTGDEDKNGGAAS